MKNYSRERAMFTLELWPLFEVFYFVMIFDGMTVVRLGVLLHPGNNDFERDQAGRFEHALRRVDGRERAITHCVHV